MHARKYNQGPSKRLKTMSTEKKQGPRVKNESVNKEIESAGLAVAFFKAEEQFQAEQLEDWKTQKSRNNRQNRFNTFKTNVQPEKDQSESRGRGSKRPVENCDNKGVVHKRPTQSCNRDGLSSQSYDSKRDCYKGPSKNNQKEETESLNKNSCRSDNVKRNDFNVQRSQGVTFSFTKLQQISTKDSTDIIRILANSGNGLDEFLSGKIKPDCMYLIVKILRKLTLSDWEENKEHVLLRAACPEFFKKITEFVTFLVTDEQSYKRRDEMEQFFENLLIFFQAILTKLPTVAAEHLMGPLRATRMAMGGVSDYQNVTINTRLHEKMKQLMSDFDERKREKEEREKVVKEEIEAVYPKPLGNITEVPLFPRPEDISCAEGSLVPNKIVGPYNNVEHYLDIQFRLLREDYIAPLRQGIKEYRIGHTNNTSYGRKRKASNIRIYPRVRFLQPKVIADKVGYDICFDPEKRLRVKWECTKRFIYGSLLLFTTDNFHTFFLATVVKRDLAVVEKDRIISVILSDTNALAQEILSKEFVMAESEVYFEPYYHVLKALQKFTSDTFPMQKYFVYVKTETNRPAYTQNGSDIFTISVGENGINGRKTIKLFDDHTWPSPEELDFDISQLSAFKAALTSDLAVIQGPPGTGKTFLGLKIAAALLENSAIWNNNQKTPILVICFTNHALDQFLEGILLKGLTNNIVRIGGRSKSEQLEPFNLRERRMSGAFYSPNYYQAALLKDLRKEMSDIFENIKTLQDNLEHLDKNNGIISLKTLRLVIRDNHMRFFKNNDDLLEWLLFDVSYKDRAQKKLISTADKGVERTKTDHSSEDFGFECLDFENVTRLKEVLFDSIDFEEKNESDSNSKIRMYFTCTFEDIEKKMEEYSKQLNSLPGSEGDRETIQRKMKDAKNAESDLGSILGYLKVKLKNTGIPSQEETIRLSEIENLSSLNCNDRWILYKSWIEFLKAGYWMMIGKLEERYRRGARRYEEVRQFDDLRIVQQADVVGITTSTAARLQAMLRELKAKIVIVEEAAEVLEAHIVASLSVYCQHLILIGDHKQLRPSPAEYRLCKEYHLDVSLFERLINNNISYHTLNTQHRMRPEISRLLVPTIYPTLSDHPSTYTRDQIRGMDKNIFFMNHNQFEDEVDDIMSKKNGFEARMVMSLARHLLLQGYRPDEITVLTTYKGQMFLLKEEQKRLEISKDLLVTVVDNFQGEENKIILLSLVRSNTDNRIGFLKTENRVCVALSRARDGLYVFGNMDCLTADSILWQRIKQSFTDQQAFGPGLILRCEIHRDQITRIMNITDWTQVLEGGCSKPCNESLPCQHKCKSLCHVNKDRHIQYRCSEPCIRTCPERHPCSKKCYQQCDQCSIPMERTLDCGHKILLPCCVEYRKVQCKQLVTLKFLHCEHETQVECFCRNIKQCPQPCTFRLECGHACTNTCHGEDDPDHIEYKCPKACARQPLGCTTEGHKCPGICCEPCTPCEAMVVRNLACGHSKTMKCTDSDLRCKVPCGRSMTCGHICKNACWEECGNCRVMVEKVVPLCGHKVKVQCSKVPRKEYCEGKCSVTLSCGHKCAKRCKDPCSEQDCVVATEMPVALPCGHNGAHLPCKMVHNIDFGSSTEMEEMVQYCSEPCLEILKCKHRCSGTCGQCMQGRIHKVCDEDCGNTLICGHSCPVPCRQVCPPCDKKCQMRCVHSKCPKKCGEPCISCKEPCEYKCIHIGCKKKCGDLCDKKPCTEPCYLKLKCSHACVGFCGEPCPPCKQCNPKLYEPFFYMDEEEEEDAKWVLLNDCKHVVESRTMEKWLTTEQEGGASEIKHKVCPKCRPNEPQRYIITTQRYMNMVKTVFKDIQAVKEKLYGKVEDIREERKKLLREIEKIPQMEMQGFTNHDNEYDALYEMYNQLRKDLPITRHQRRKEVGIERLRVLAYTVLYLTTLVNRRKKIWSQLNHNTKSKWMTKVNRLTNALRKREKKISNSEIESFNLELNRLVRFSELLIVESCGEYQQLKTNQEVIQFYKKAENLISQFLMYSNDHDEKVISAIEDVIKAIRCNASITPEERRMINLAMSKSYYGGSSAQGHWFKCSNGHIYTITECGGAMVAVRCPIDNCNAMIGGTNHRYLPNQQLASEMDGATRPAWSSGFDMNNFDLNNLH